MTGSYEDFLRIKLAHVEPSGFDAVELPGSVLHDTEERWSPSRYEVLDRATGRMLGSGASEREAVDRAVMLWGRR